MTEKASSGKVVAGRVYLHISALHDAGPAVSDLVVSASQAAQRHPGQDFNIVRIDAGGVEVALLQYPQFFEDPFPALLESWRVNTETGAVAYRTYEHSLNPPILHRKELLLASSDPRRAEYAPLTESAEAIGLFDDQARIGYQRQWFQLVRERGYRVVGHALVPLGNDESEAWGPGEPERSLHAGWAAARERTAMVRYGLSAPIQSLARYGFFGGERTVFDYGCGRGDDLRGLKENGISASGWDPYYAPDEVLQPADIVNLGFVVNVIEDFDERLEALTRAWSLAQQLLVVSVMLDNQNEPRGTCFRDGVMTQRGTFQKYYTQTEIRTYLERSLDEEPIPVAPGIHYLFRDKDHEQRFLMERYRGRRNVFRRPLRVPRERIARAPRRNRTEERYQAYREPLDRLWGLSLKLGRVPDKSEVKDMMVLTEAFGGLGRAWRFIASRHGTDALEDARASRIMDLEVYFALNLFERRKPYRQLEMGLQRDIRAFFGDYAAAMNVARERLFAIASPEAINQACQEASEHGLGWLEQSESLQLHASMVEQLPALLRIYVGCAAALYGDYRNADLIKIHIRSGKVSLMRYDDFEGSPLPRMVERVKIKLREQDIDYFAYGERFEPPFLYRKSRYINEEFPNYPEQVAFEQSLDDLGWFDLTGYGPPPREFIERLESGRIAISGFRLARSRRLPDLDELCGQYLSFRQLIQCGETQARTALANLPREVDSYNALYDLAVNVLDPVIDYFGMIRLTYGFSSPELARKITGRIDPKRDQHAAHEENRRGKPICPRLGAAVDFIVEDESMQEVARWIAVNTPFDRLYFYGDTLPIHVSYGPDQSRQVVRMKPGPSGRLVPRVMPVTQFVAE